MAKFSTSNPKQSRNTHDHIQLSLFESMKVSPKIFTSKAAVSLFFINIVAEFLFGIINFVGFCHIRFTCSDYLL